MGAGGSGNPVMSLIWLLLLIFVGFWVAGFCAGLYIFVYAIEACVPAIKDISELLLRGVQLPHLFAKNMLSGAPLGG